MAGSSVLVLPGWCNVAVELDAFRLPAFAILLNFCCPKAGEAVAVDRLLPVEELVDSQSIARTRFFESEQTTPHSCDNLSLPTDNPTLGVGVR